MEQTKKEREAFIKITKVFDKCDNIEQIVTYSGVCRPTVENYLAFTEKVVRPRNTKQRASLCEKHFFEDITGKELMRKTKLPYGYVMAWLVGKRRGVISHFNKISKYYRNDMTADRLTELSGMPYGTVYLWMCRKGYAKKYPKPKCHSPKDVPLPKRVDRKNKYPVIELEGLDKLDYIKQNAKKLDGHG